MNPFIPATLLSLLMLTSCGPITKSQKQSLDATGQSYSKIIKGAQRAKARLLLGRPQTIQPQQDLWEQSVDPANGESLKLNYDQRDVIIDGERSSWRGDDHGMFRWGKRVSYYLPDKSQNPPKEALRTGSTRKELRLH
jgi:hypothetical protein